MIYFTKPSGRVKQANPVFAPPRASNWLASLAVIGLFASPAYGQTVDPNDQQPAVCTDEDRADGCVLLSPSEAFEGLSGDEPVAGIYEITFDNGDLAGQTFRVASDAEIIIGVDTKLTVLKPDGTPLLVDGVPMTIDYDGSTLGRQVSINTVRRAVGRQAGADAVSVIVGQASIAQGRGAVVKGQNSIAIGEGSSASTIIPEVFMEAAVPGVYQIVIENGPNAGTYRVQSSEAISIGQDSELVIVDSDGEATAETVTYDGSVAGRRARISTISNPMPATMPMPERRGRADEATAVGAYSNVQSHGGSAYGAGASVAGEGSVAIGRNARVGTAVRPAVPGLYNVVRPAYVAGTFASVSGTISGTTFVLTQNLEVPTTSAMDSPTITLPAGTKIDLTSRPTATSDGGTVPTSGDQTGTFAISYAAVTDTTITDVEGTIGENGLLTVTSPVTVEGLTVNTGQGINLAATGTVVIRSPVEAGGTVFSAANYGVAIGDEARVTGHRGIAIGAEVTAGANQIRIGRADQTDVRIGAYNLANINTNTNDIETNRAGIASAVAMANLPSVQGPKGGWSLALGSFDGETAIAGGINFDFRQIGTIKIGVASSGGETSGGIGFGMGF